MPRAKDSDEEILKEAKARFERCVGWESAWRTRALFDTRFANGDSQNGCQWYSNAGTMTDRGDRPTLTYNQVRQHNLQMINDARQNKAQIKVTPVGGHASYEAAQVFSGIIRRIEYVSKAVDAYSTATYHQVESGIGYVRVETDYVDENSFDLDLFIRRVPDPRSVYMDPDCKAYDKSDANFAFVFEDIPRDRYEEEYGKEDNVAPATLEHSDGWNDKDHVRIAEYWRRNLNNETLHRLQDGTVVRDSEIPAEFRDQVKAMIVQIRDVAEPEIEWFKLAGNKIIDREQWLGKYIPIVPFIGEETVIEGEMDRKGHTRAQIDAQRIYNYWASAAVEQVALQTKTPYVARADAIEGRTEQWATANVKNWSVLVYNGIDEAGNPIPPPSRVEPPTMAQAYIQGMTIARQDLMSVTGQYQAELGMPSNERSGIAIQQRQRQGDTATYHYIDNQAKGIRQIGRILLDLIPKIYDTRRVAMTLAEDGTENKVMIAPDMADAHQYIGQQPNGAQPGPISPAEAQKQQEDPEQPDPAIIFNPNVGTYDVEADVGPSLWHAAAGGGQRFQSDHATKPGGVPDRRRFLGGEQRFPRRGRIGGAPEARIAAAIQSGTRSAGPGRHPAGAADAAAGAGACCSKADAEIASLKAQLVHAQEQAKDKSAEIEIKDYQAETDRLKAVGAIDPLALQAIVRQMVSDMLQTEIHPVLQRHAADQSELQATLAPPVPVNGANGQAASGPAPGGGVGP